MTNVAQIILSLLGSIVVIAVIALIASLIKKNKPSSISDTCSCTSAPDDCCVVSEVSTENFVMEVGSTEEPESIDMEVEVKFLEPDKNENDHDDEEPYLLTDEVKINDFDKIKTFGDPIESSNDFSEPSASDYDPELVNPFIVVHNVMKVVHMDCIYCGEEIIRGAARCFSCGAEYYFIEHWKGETPLDMEIYNKVVNKIEKRINTLKTSSPVDMKALQESKQRLLQWNTIHEIVG